MTQPHIDNGHTDFNRSKVSAQRSLALPERVRLVEYRNGDERVFYQNDDCHTFSLYLDGGFETVRTDQTAPNGGPGRFCVMPKGAYSAWEIGSDQGFVHLYFDDDYLKRLALKTFDIDPRRVELPQLTFDQDPAIEALCRYGLVGWDWRGADASLALEQGVQTLLVNLLKQLKLDKPESKALTGGLAPQVQARVVAFIHAHFQRQIRLSELAEVAQLSEYHLCRMFKRSLAQTPQQYLTRLRVEHAQRLLEQVARQPQHDAPSLAQIALDCGFSNQSHLGRYFKQLTGLTPGRYLQLQRL